MTSNLEQQAREALLRALPYIHDSRRELVLSALMSNPAIDDWYDSWHQTQVVENTYQLEQYAFRICAYIVPKNDPRQYAPVKHWVYQLNKLIDAREPRNP